MATDPDNQTHARWIKSGKTNADELIADAERIGVDRLICVGTSVEDSVVAVDFVQNQDNCWASIGIHPHEAARYIHHQDKLDEFLALAKQPKVVAVGECGLDYYYNHSPKEAQYKILEFQLDLAQKHDLPCIFHVRDAYDDFLAILSQFEGIRGVVHSFTANRPILDKMLSEGLYIGLNGIMTFTKDQEQLAAAQAVPSKSLLLETDAPFLTPAPYRGTICEPKHVRVTAEFLSDLRGESLEEIARTTTHNAGQLFRL